MKFDLIKHLPVSLSIFFCTFWNMKYTLRLALYLKTLPMTATLQPALSGYWWLSAREQEAVITTLVWEPEKQVRGVRLGCHPAVAARRKKQSDTWVAVALHVIELRISLVRLCVGFEKTQDGSVGHQRKSWLLKEVKPTNQSACGLGSVSVFPGLFFYIPVENWLDGLMSASNNYNGGLMQWKLFRHFNHRWHARFLRQLITQYRLNTSKKVKKTKKTQIKSNMTCSCKMEGRRLKWNPKLMAWNLK